MVHLEGLAPARQRVCVRFVPCRCGAQTRRPSCLTCSSIEAPLRGAHRAPAYNPSQLSLQGHHYETRQPVHDRTKVCTPSYMCKLIETPKGLFKTCLNNPLSSRCWHRQRPRIHQTTDRLSPRTSSAASTKASCCPNPHRLSPPAGARHSPPGIRRCTDHPEWKTKRFVSRTREVSASLPEAGPRRAYNPLCAESARPH